jgi:predicted Zn finger-like uncharacterized protein
MLFTRCPHCQTTFHITVDVLMKADGEVRCGRCAEVFNAFAELRGRSSHESADEGLPPAKEGAETPAQEDAPRHEDGAVAAPEPDGDTGGEIADRQPPAAAPPAEESRDDGQVETASTPEQREADMPIEAWAELNGEADAHELLETDEHAPGPEAAAQRSEQPTSPAAETPAGDDTLARTDEFMALDIEGIEAVTEACVPSDENHDSAPQDEDMSAAPAESTAPDTPSDDTPSDNDRETDASAAEATSAPAREGPGAQPDGPAETSGSAQPPSALVTAEAGDEEPLSPEQAHFLLLSETEHENSVPRPLEAAEPGVQMRWWGLASVLALALLTFQMMHHFRAELASEPIVGPLLRGAYGGLGMKLVPRWDVDQYRIVDWSATAEPNAEGKGTLRIEARLTNRGPRSQPYPRVRLDLKDRWEASVASRVFAPGEYLSSGAAAGALMKPGETVDGILEVVDPGPDAYGFELDVCVENNEGTLNCANDKVFR